MPGADESYWYREAGLSQQACAISSEASSCLSCWNVEGAYSNLLCTVVMEDGCQKSKRLSYMAKFKREVIQCAEEKDNRKVTAIFGVDESNVWLWRKHKTAISGWSWWKQRLTVAETQDSNQWVWGVTKDIHWTQERTISWNWWCSLHVFSR